MAVSSSRQITRQGVYGDLLLGDLLSKKDNSLSLKDAHIFKLSPLSGRKVVFKAGDQSSDINCNHFTLYSLLYIVDSANRG